jgi:hypothetical protein
MDGVSVEPICLQCIPRVEKQFLQFQICLPGEQGDQIGRLFALSSLLEITKLSHIIGNYKIIPQLSHSCLQRWLIINFVKKMSWAAYWAIFSLTHLVTLLANEKAPFWVIHPTV